MACGSVSTAAAVFFDLAMELRISHQSSQTNVREATTMKTLARFTLLCENGGTHGFNSQLSAPLIN